MHWRTLALLAGLAIAASGQAPSALAHAVVPVLAGPWSTNQRGYGHARPTTVFNGGDPTGLVQHIRWKTWGGARAIGVGTGWYVGPHQSTAEGTQEPVRIVVFQLGYCHGRRAYEAIEWYFPQHGGRFQPNSYIEACTGEYHE